MSYAGGRSQSQGGACAACKFQRRRCLPDCLLAPYFPADNPEIFNNAHRLFGVRKMTRALAGIPDKSLRDDFMTSVIYESNMWKLFPSLGCGFAISHYVSVINDLEAELASVHAQLAQYYQSGRGADQVPIIKPPKGEHGAVNASAGCSYIPRVPTALPCNQQQLGINFPSLHLDNTAPTAAIPQQHQYYSHDNTRTWIRNPYVNNSEDENDDKEDGEDEDGAAAQVHTQPADGGRGELLQARLKGIARDHEDKGQHFSRLESPLKYLPPSKW